MALDDKKNIQDNKNNQSTDAADTNKDGSIEKTKKDGRDKKSNKRKRPKFGFSNTIKSSLTACLLLSAGAVMLICFTISVTVLNSVKKNAAERFYTNTFDAAFQQRINSDSRLKLLSLENQLVPVRAVISSNEDLFKFKNEMNSMLTKDYTIADIYIADETNMDNLSNNLNTMRNNLIPLRALEKNIAKERKQSSLYNRTKKYNRGNIIEIIKYADEKKERRNYTIYLLLDQKSFYKDNLMSSLVLSFGIIALIYWIGVSMLVGSIVNPLNAMEKTVSRIAKGDLSGRLDYTKYEEINKLAKAYNMMANALQRLYSSLEAQVNDRTMELKKAYAELKSTQAMMVHSEKMKSLGELVAGIMHEINNPINFIYGNMTHLDNYSKDLIAVIDEYEKYEKSLKPEEKSEIEKMKTDCDYEFLKTDMPDLIKSCKEGADRAKNIIQDLKSFSRMEEVSIRDVDIPAEIDTVLNILHNKIKNKANVHKEYAANIPKVEAFGGQLNQVFMNILDNAAGAIEKTGDIWIRINTDKAKNNLVIEIEDNGAGMDAETASKVFDPFFTTKPVGKGTGLGMSITYKIIKNHQGNIRVVSQKGKGAKFIVELPLNINREALKSSMQAGGKSNNG